MALAAPSIRILSTRSRRLLDEGFLPYLRRPANRRVELQPLFLTGLMGTGTTALGYLLAERLQVSAFVRESALQVRKTSKLHLPPTNHFASAREYIDFVSDTSHLNDPAVITDLQHLYRGLARPSLAPTVPWVIDKAPTANLFRLDALRQHFECACYAVVLVRDPVATIEGLRRKWSIFREASLRDAIELYHAAYVRAYEAIKRRRTGALIVPYDQLIHSPQRVVGLISHAAAIPQREAPLRLHGRSDNKPGKGVRNVGRDGVLLTPGADSSARQRMSDHDIKQIESDLADIHSHLRTDPHSPLSLPNGA